MNISFKIKRTNDMIKYIKQGEEYGENFSSSIML